MVIKIGLEDYPVTNVYAVPDLLLVFLMWGFFHHLVAGIRYLLLDLHMGIDLKSARIGAIVVYAVSLPLAFIAALKIFGLF